MSESLKKSKEVSFLSRDNKEVKVASFVSDPVDYLEEFRAYYTPEAGDMYGVAGQAFIEISNLTEAVTSIHPSQLNEKWQGLIGDKDHGDIESHIFGWFREAGYTREEMMDLIKIDSEQPLDDRLFERGSLFRLNRLYGE